MNKPNESGIAFIAYSGRGLVRAHNEDCVSVDGEPLECERIQQRRLTEAEDHLIVVADGMGGHVRGELASQVTVQVIGNLWRSRRPHFEPIEATRAANRAIYDAMGNNPTLRGMGATVVGAHINSTRVTWFNLGDSRGYVFRGNGLTQFTTDHVPRGVTGTSRSRSHSITQSVGGGYNLIDVWPAAGVLDARRGDLFLFCTDGLTDAVPDEMINQLLACSKSLLDAAKALVRATEENGAPDNISLVLLQT
ncbi:PP2C family protein-serine/threonine phosphatase [Tardiphaga robiniae]|uniref:PP2C family protein-serine/threonine phosphatase n=1 Tax=Tardiphaga robiniae TaxID=943830 RepID=UPI0009D6F83C|nr:protein phosphatase 2C domain-containing protein [Tardiphaga robiniae]